MACTDPAFGIQQNGGGALFCTIGGNTSATTQTAMKYNVYFRGLTVGSKHLFCLPLQDYRPVIWLHCIQHGTLAFQTMIVLTLS